MGDTYRPGGRGPRDRPPSLADRITFTGGGDNYRPGEQQRGRQNGDRTANQAEFTFSSGHQAPQFVPAGPANVNERAARRKRTRGGASGHNSERNGASFHPTARGRNNANGFRRGGYRKFAAPHERALLQTRDDSTEHVLGVANGPNKFRSLEDLSDDEEASMDIDSDKSNTNADDQGGKPKVTRVQSATRADGNSVPKWSNPDPYTVLPPPEETTGKRIDVVRFIRKAKNEMTETADANNAVAANDDFISFGEDDEDKQPLIEDDMPLLAPWARPSSHSQPLLGSLNDVVASGALPAASFAITRSAEAAGFPERPQYPRNAHKRKRAELNVGLVEDWLPHAKQHPTPWATDLRNEHLSHDPEHWLHNEILDFYDFVAPLKHENDIRHRLVERVERAIGRNHFAPVAGRIRCFGSFPAGLYLPMADMDLVYTSDHHSRGGPQSIYCSKQDLWKVARKLERKGVATGVQVIPGAKVPIIKFKDKVTGIPVDISFENLSGVHAQDTFKGWKRDYPDMVHIVALIKQFLLMRGVSEVATGGLGGFSIICLVVHWIQLHPKPENLGQFLVKFLDYYGNEFDLSQERIEMYPPFRVAKDEYGIDNRKEKPDGLSIQDPNRPDNNISGGSHRAKDIFMAFSKAHRDLTERMAAIQHGAVSSNSILESIIGGNYSSYLAHRRQMRNLNMQTGQQAQTVGSASVPSKPPKHHNRLPERPASRSSSLDQGTSSMQVVIHD